MKEQYVHVTDSDILLYIEGTLPVDDRQRIEHHIGRCDDCAGRFATLARLPSILKEDAPARIDRKTFRKAVSLVGDTQRTTRRSFMIFGSPLRTAFAGSAVLLVIFTAYLLVPRQEPAQFRSAETSVPLFRMFPADGARVTERRPAFHWSSVAQSSVYKLSLLDWNGVTIHSWDVRDTSLLLPSTVVLVPGKSYLWRVETFLADRSLERSALHTFTYAPPE